MVRMSWCMKITERALVNIALFKIIIGDMIVKIIGEWHVPPPQVPRGLINDILSVGPTAACQI